MILSCTLQAKFMYCGGVHFRLKMQPTNRLESRQRIWNSRKTLPLCWSTFSQYYHGSCSESNLREEDTNLSKKSAPTITRNQSSSIIRTPKSDVAYVDGGDHVVRLFLCGRLQNDGVSPSHLFTAQIGPTQIQFEKIFDLQRINQQHPERVIGGSSVGTRIQSNRLCHAGRNRFPQFLCIGAPQPSQGVPVDTRRNRISYCGRSFVCLSCAEYTGIGGGNYSRLWWDRIPLRKLAPCSERVVSRSVSGDARSGESVGESSSSTWSYDFLERRRGWWRFETTSTTISTRWRRRRGFISDETFNGDFRWLDNRIIQHLPWLVLLDDDKTGCDYCISSGKHYQMETCRILGRRDWGLSRNSGRWSFCYNCSRKGLQCQGTKHFRGRNDSVAFRSFLYIQLRYGNMTRLTLCCGLQCRMSQPIFKFTNEERVRFRAGTWAIVLRKTVWYCSINLGCGTTTVRMALH